VKKPNYGKYSMDGHETHLAVFEFSADDDDLIGLMVWALIGKNQNWFAYGSDKESFDQKLLLPGKVLESIKLSPDQTS
jgi:hypothetical protein